MIAVRFVVPEGIDDPTRPSGGNTYDRQLTTELSAGRVTVTQTAAPGPWPRPNQQSLHALEVILSCAEDGEVVLIDGLVASASSEVLLRHGSRLRLVILMHLPLGCDPNAAPGIRTAEKASLFAATAVITTSPWTRDWLINRYALAPGTVHVAEPGVEPAEVSSGSAHGGRFVCVAALVPHKGQDVLIEALALIGRGSWDCRLVGSDLIDRSFTARLRHRTHKQGISGQVSFLGTRTGAPLAATYASADLLIAPSRTDTYGMVVTEALAHGTPVIASDVGGLPMALGIVAECGRPGMLVPPDEPALLAALLTRWLDDEDMRARLRAVARDRRSSLVRWSDTARLVSRVIETVAA